MLKKGVLLILVLALALAVWAFLIEPSLLHIKRVSLTVDTWPRSIQGLKLIVLSDLHVGAPHIDIEYLQNVVNKVNTEQPDIILLCGDYVITGVPGGHFINPDQIFLALSDLRAKQGVYAVLGNHDWWWDGTKTAESIEENGITLLENKSTSIHFQENEIIIVGIGDETTQHHNMTEAFNAVSEVQNVLTFTHSPDLFPQIPQAGDINIAGHTHGGQVNLPFVGRLVVPSRYKQRYAAGTVRENEKIYFITTGIGTSVIPVRFRVSPEIAVITINGSKI